MANDVGLQTNPEENNRNFTLELTSRVALTAIAHPFEYVKVLIQIGHEPLPPNPTRTLFGRPALALPGAFKYIKHIKAVDGFFGLYCGLPSKLCSSLVSGYVFANTIKRLPMFGEPVKNEKRKKEEEEEEEELTEEEKVIQFLGQTLRETIARCAAVLVSHPFQVITIRTMAQFVGREEHYRGILPSISHIFREEGIRGYFVGMVPRMIGEVLTLWFAKVATFVVNTYIVEEKVLRSYIGTSLLYVANALTYPFALVSHTMTVNNCGLAAGLPPNMPIYYNWMDCWKHLSACGQLKRGSSILWRYYTGPMAIDSLGRPAYPPKRIQFKRPSANY